MHCAKIDWNWPSGSEEEDFFNFLSVFLLFGNYLPFEKGGPFISTNLNSLYTEMLCPIGSGEEGEHLKGVRRQQ